MLTRRFVLSGLVAIVSPKIDLPYYGRGLVLKPFPINHCATYCWREVNSPLLLEAVLRFQRNGSGEYVSQEA